MLETLTAFVRQIDARLDAISRELAEHHYGNAMAALQKARRITKTILEKIDRT